MKSSEERPREADMADSRNSESAPAITQDEVRAMMTEESIWSYRLRKFDPGVQLGRLALILGFWWLWWSETIWDGWDAIPSAPRPCDCQSSSDMAASSRTVLR